MDITDIREHVEIMWTLANNFLRSNTDRKCFHGISYSEMMKMQMAGMGPAEVGVRRKVPLMQRQA